MIAKIGKAGEQLAFNAGSRNISISGPWTPPELYFYVNDALFDIRWIVRSNYGNSDAVVKRVSHGCRNPTK
jgi:hypothetical protein